MIELRAGTDRGYADHGWLKSFHSFSFAGYHDPRHMGFGAHGHRDMEIVSYVLDGALAHRDSMGNGSVIRPGDVQRMSAGSGVMHSEFNHEKQGETHFLQIWIEPAVRGIAPGYEEKRFDAAAKRGRLALVASPDGADGSVTIHQDARIHAGLFDGDERAGLAIAPGRRSYVHVARGAVTVNGHALRAGDAVKLVGEPALEIAGGQHAEVLVFDLP